MAMNIAYQEMLDRIVPAWRSMTSLEIIGALLEAYPPARIDIDRHVANGDCK